MTKLKKLLVEVSGLFSVMGLGDFLRWCWLCLLKTPVVLRTGSLGPVDQAFGTRVRYRCAGRWWTIEDGALGVVREIAAGECYVPGRELAEAKVILDLGGNCGVFTLFALGHAPKAAVMVVETNPATAPVLRENLRLNGVEARATVAHAYAGAETDYVRKLRQSHPDIGHFNLEAWLHSVGECDFLKCDIEGAEYGLFDASSTWLRRVKRMSLEYHGTWNDGAALAEIIRRHGFEVTQKPHGALGYLVCFKQGGA